MSEHMIMRSARLLVSLLFVMLVACSDAPRFANTDITGADFGRDFSLTDHNGQARHLADFRGKALVVFFGYTQCPDVCPTTLVGIADAMNLLGEDAKRVQVVFITLDPERDNKALLANYVPQFNPSFLGLYSDLAGTAATAKEYRVFYQKQPGTTPTTYSIDHTAVSYVYDPQGRVRLLFAHDASAQTLAADLTLLLADK